MNAATTRDSLPGLYLHVPFCHSKCHYCDFYSTPVHAKELHGRFIDAALRELGMRAEAPGEWNTIYIGGGTPSIVGPGLLKRFAEGAGTSRGEFTVEANPEDVTPGWLLAMKETGVNRVSMGVQSFNDNELKAVGRRHDAHRALNALGLLRDAGMNYSVDLIYGLPGQTLESWRRSLSVLEKFRPPHFSAYLLSYEPGTRLHARLMAGTIAEASDDEADEMYRVLVDWARANGYRHYEISNFALPGKEAAHNSSYWSGRPYVGLGPGAHSFDGERRSYNPSNLKEYIKVLDEGRLPGVVDDETPRERLNDVVITALRTDRGLHPSSLLPFGNRLAGQVERNLEEMASKGLLETSPDGAFVIPESLWLRADAILRELIIV